MTHPSVHSALIGGESRPKPFLLIELEENVEMPRTQMERQRLIEELWPAVKKANQMCSEYVRIERELTIIVSPERPLARTAKASVSRRESLELYKEEIKAIYRNLVAVEARS